MSGGTAPGGQWSIVQGQILVVNGNIVRQRTAPRQRPDRGLVKGGGLYGASGLHERRTKSVYTHGAQRWCQEGAVSATRLTADPLGSRVWGLGFSYTADRPIHCYRCMGPFSPTRETVVPRCRCPRLFALSGAVATCSSLLIISILNLAVLILMCKCTRARARANGLRSTRSALPPDPFYSKSLVYLCNTRAHTRTHASAHTHTHTNTYTHQHTHAHADARGHARARTHTHTTDAARR